MRKIVFNAGFAILPVLVIVLVLGVLGVTVYQVQQNQNISERASVEPPPPTPEVPQDQVPSNNCGGVPEGSAIRDCVTGCPPGTTGTCGGHVYCEGGSPGGCQCETEDQTCKPVEPPSTGCGGVPEGSAIRTCTTNCGSGQRGTCGGHVYCEGGQPGECQCETGDLTCRPEDLRSCPIGQCFEGDCVPTETYWECDLSCGDNQERQISKQKSAAGGCDYVKGGCRANASCGAPQPSGNQKGEKGDVDGDGDSDTADLGVIIENFGRFLDSILPYDLDKDKDVDIVDFGIWRDSFMKSL